MKNKMVAVLDNNIAFFCFVSFLLSVIVYLVIGSKVGISDLLAISLAVSGGLWSLMTVEQGKVKELRSEYISSLKDLENACLESIYLSGHIFSRILKFDIVDAADVELKRERYLEIIDLMNDLNERHMYYTYVLINISNNEKNKKTFDFLDLLMKHRLKVMQEYVNSLSRNNLVLKKSDEDDMNSLIIKSMEEMNDVFSKDEVGFEDFSENYLFIKVTCFSIIMTFVFSVFLKAVFQ